MKQKFILTVLYLSTLWLYTLAQTPGFNYQAVLRDSEGAPMPNANVTLYISLTDGPEGAVLYRESQTLTTNALGMLNTTVGNGTVETGQMADITGVQNLNIKLEADVPGEPDVVDFGFTKVSATPYALYGEDADADPDNEMQTLSLEGDSLKISEMGGIDINAINHWKKTDAGFELNLANTARSSTDDEIRVTVRKSSEVAAEQLGDFFIDFLNGREKKETGIRSEKISIDDQTVFSDILLPDVYGQLPMEKQQQILSDYNLSTLEGFAGREIQTSISSSLVLGNLLTGRYLEQTKIGEGVETRGQIGPNGCDLSLLLEGNPAVKGFADQSNMGIGFDVFKLGGYPTSGLSGAVFMDQNSRSDQSATFGGIYATANDNALTTLSGLFPGINPDRAFQIVFNGSNFGVVHTNNSEAAGTTTTYGANGEVNVTLGTFAGNPDGGAVITYDQAGNRGAYIWTRPDGSSQMEADAFIMSTPAPGRSNSRAHYAAPVGGEAAVYDRGTAQLVNGRATVAFPEHFRWIANEATMTVTITPLSGKSRGIAVVNKSATSFSVEELDQGTGNYAFDYLVMCKRKGQEDFQVQREALPELMNKEKELLRKLPAGAMRSIRDLHNVNIKQ